MHGMLTASKNNKTFHPSRAFSVVKTDNVFCTNGEGQNRLVDLENSLPHALYTPEFAPLLSLK